MSSHIRVSKKPKMVKKKLFTFQILPSFPTFAMFARAKCLNACSPSFKLTRNREKRKISKQRSSLRRAHGTMEATDSSDYQMRSSGCPTKSNSGSSKHARHCGNLGELRWTKFLHPQATE